MVGKLVDFWSSNNKRGENRFTMKFKKQESKDFFNNMYKISRILAKFDATCYNNNSTLRVFFTGKDLETRLDKFKQQLEEEKLNHLVERYIFDVMPKINKNEKTVAGYFAKLKNGGNNADKKKGDENNKNKNNNNNNKNKSEPKVDKTARKAIADIFLPHWEIVAEAIGAEIMNKDSYKNRQHVRIPTVNLKFKSEEECNKYIPIEEFAGCFDCAGYEIIFGNNVLIKEDVVKKN